MLRVSRSNYRSVDCRFRGLRERLPETANSPSIVVLPRQPLCSDAEIGLGLCTGGHRQNSTGTYSLESLWKALAHILRMARRGFLCRGFLMQQSSDAMLAGQLLLQHVCYSLLKCFG